MDCNQKMSKMSDDDDVLSYTDDEDSSVYLCAKPQIPSKSKPEPPRRKSPVKAAAAAKRERITSIKVDQSDDDDEDYDPEEDNFLKDPFGYGDVDPFLASGSADDHGFSTMEEVPMPFDVEPPINIIQAKLRILACCRDLSISVDKAIRYEDVQTIYFCKFGARLNKKELNMLFGDPSAASVIDSEFYDYLAINSSAQNTKNQGLRLVALGNIDEWIEVLENTPGFGEVTPIPRLSHEEVENIIRPKLPFNPATRTKNLYSRPSRRDIYKLRGQGFAKENFVDLPRVRNPVILEVDENSADDFTDNENELQHTPFVSLAPRRKYVINSKPGAGSSIRESITATERSGSRTTLLSSSRSSLTSGLEGLRNRMMQRRRGYYNENLSDDEVIYSDEEENDTASQVSSQLSLFEPVRRAHQPDLPTAEEMRRIREFELLEENQQTLEEWQRIQGYPLQASSDDSFEYGERPQIMIDDIEFDEEDYYDYEYYDDDDEEEYLESESDPSLELIGKNW